MSFDLERRTLLFSKSSITAIRKVPATIINGRMIEQAVGSITSIGANYREAIESESRKDFIHKMMICKKEIKESLYWIELLAHTNTMLNSEFRILWKEAHELLLIFSRIVYSTKKNYKK